VDEPQTDLGVLKSQLADLRSTGQNEVEVARLIEWIDSYGAQQPSAVNPQFELERYKAILENDRLSYRARHESAMQMFDSVISSGQGALRAALVLGGGSCVALLAFFGNIWNKGVGESTITGLSQALSLFTFAVLSAVVAYGGTYLTQFVYAREWTRLGNVGNVITIILVVSSYVLFVLGAFEANDAIRAHLTAAA